MIIMGTLPDTGWRQDIPAEDGHQDIRGPAVVQDGMVLIVVIDDERTDHDQSCKYAASDFPCQRGDEYRSRQGQ